MPPARHKHPLTKQQHLFDLQPTLKGLLLSLRPLQEQDFEGLYTVASDPLVWEQHPMLDRHKRDVFQKFFDAAIASKGAFAVIENTTEKIIGSSRYYIEEGVFYIGYTFLGRAYWGGKFNQEMKSLMLNHAFQYLDAVYFQVGEHNVRSQKAMAKVGGKFVRTMERLGHGPNGPVNSLVYKIERPS